MTDRATTDGARGGGKARAINEEEEDNKPGIGGDSSEEEHGEDEEEDFVMYLDGGLWWPATASKPKSGMVRINFFGEPTYEIVPVEHCEPYHSSGKPLYVPMHDCSVVTKANRMKHLRAMEDAEVDTD